MRSLVKKCAAMVAVVAATGGINGVYGAYPLATDDAGIVKTNFYELEAGYDNCRGENVLLNQSCGISFKHGLTEKMDIGLSVPVQIDPVKEDRLGESALTLKFSLIREMLAFSFSNAFGEKDYFINAIFTKEFSSVIVNVNAGYLSTGDETVKGTGTHSVSLEIPIKRYEVVGEVQGQEGGIGNCLLGLRYRITDSFFVAAGFSRALDADTNKGTTGFHFSF